MRKFRLHWLDGKTEIVEGIDISNAFTHAGYSSGAIAALDWYEPITEDEYLRYQRNIKKTFSKKSS
jgi:hypothetical protein